MDEKLDRLFEAVVDGIEKALPHTDKLVEAAIIYALYEIGQAIGNPMLGVISYKLATTPSSGEVSEIEIGWGGLKIPASAQFVGILGLSTLGVIAGISGLDDLMGDKIPTDQDIEDIVDENTSDDGVVDVKGIIDDTSDLINSGVSAALQGTALDAIVQATVDARAGEAEFTNRYITQIKLAMLPIYAAEKIRRGEPLE